jgi:hypothetical protein
MLDNQYSSLLIIIKNNFTRVGTMSKMITINNLVILILVLAGVITVCGEHQGLIMA